MDNKYNYILEVKRKLQQTSWTYEKKEIIREAVKHLKSQGYTESEIRESFRIDHLREQKEQNNAQMVSNNSEYVNLLNDILNS